MSCKNVDFVYLRSIVLEESANVLDPSRDYLFESLLQDLLMTSGLATLSRLVAALRLELDPALRRSVAEAMTVKETSFFRDRLPFELLHEELLPRIIRGRESTRRLRLWSAACSNGQEPYSVAMILREHCRSQADMPILSMQSVRGSAASREIRWNTAAQCDDVLPGRSPQAAAASCASHPAG